MTRANPLRPPRTPAEESAPPVNEVPSRLTQAAESRVAELRRFIEKARSANQMTANYLHQLHRSLRGTRVLVQLLERGARGSERSNLATLDSRLRTLARLVGSIRDFDVSADLLESATPRPAAAGTSKVLRGAIVRFREDALAGRELLRAYLDTERHRGLVQEVSRLPPLSRERDPALQGALEREHVDRHDRLRGARRRALRKPSSRRIHAVRIELRRTRHLLELKQSSETEPFPRPLARLQAEMGRLHDLDLLLGQLEAGRETPAPEHFAPLRDEQDRVRRSVVRTLRSGSFRRLVRRLRP
jgi:CHAD domain-containing protein